MLQKSDQQIVMREPSDLDDNNVIENLMQNHDVLLSTFRSRLTKLQVIWRKFLKERPLGFDWFMKNIKW